MREICDRYEVLFIADEVITGFGRLGTWFGVERFNVEPDILVFAKGISGGYAPLGGFAVRSGLLEAFAGGSGRFEHNFTFAGHPVATAAGVAVLKILVRERLVERVAAHEALFFEALRKSVGDIDIVGDVRGCGLLAGVELVSDRARMRPFPARARTAAAAARCAMDEGVVVYPCSGGVDGEGGDYLLLMPPFVSTPGDLAEMAIRLGRGLRRLSRDRKS